MTINNPQLFNDGIWDWGFLDDCFAPSRIKVSDIDGISERNGHLLVLETKAAGVQVKTGQMILFRQIVRAGNHVLIIWGYQDEPRHDLLYITPEGECHYRNVGKEVIQAIVRDWYRWADGQGPVMPDALRPFLDRPLTVDEVEAAFVHVRQFNVQVTQGLAGNGKFSLSVKY